MGFNLSSSLRTAVTSLLLTVVTIAGGLKASAIAEARDTLTARHVFVELPLQNLDLLSRSTRLDMVDFYDVDSIYQARNGLEGISELVSMTPGYLEVKITPVTTLQIRILPTGKDDIALCINTIGNDRQASDSRLTFFSQEMEELQASKYIDMPKLLDFFDAPDKEARNRIEELVPFPTIEFVAGPDSTSLTARLTVGSFMSRESYDSIKTMIRQPLTYTWNGRRYTLDK